LSAAHRAVLVPRDVTRQGQLRQIRHGRLRLGYLGKLVPNIGALLLDSSWGRLVLNHIRVLHQEPILDAKNVGRNPVPW